MITSFSRRQFLGAATAAELLAATLYEYGAGGAKSVTFIADGATCLWDRFDWIVETLKLPASKVSYVLDFFHASHQVSLALSHLGHSKRLKRKPLIVIRLDVFPKRH